MKLTDILGFCFDTLRTYGKEPEQLGSVNKMFQFVLADYPIDKIASAFRYYFTISNEMPTPADIVNIIRRGNKPPLDKVMYQALVKKRERTTEKFSYGSYDDLSKEEKQYIKDYEEFNIKGEIS